jgi:hypothetical protein
MANKQGSFLVTLGKRMLGFSRSSSGCCAAPAADGSKASEVTCSDINETGPKMPENTREVSCCAPPASTRGRKPR